MNRIATPLPTNDAILRYLTNDAIWGHVMGGINIHYHIATSLTTNDAMHTVLLHAVLIWSMAPYRVMKWVVQNMLLFSKGLSLELLGIS